MNERNCGLCIPCALGKYDECETVQELHPEISLEARVTELDSKLAASEEARKTIEANAQIEIDRLNAQILDRDTKLEAAEQRIKTSQEQKPVGYCCMSNGNPHSFSLLKHNYANEIPLFAQPIPPELSEVVRERDELWRKLAEQRMEINLLDEIGKLLADYEYKGSYADAVRNLLEEAKRQAVSEDIAKDAERYRWIMRQAKLTDAIFAYLKSGERHVSNAIDKAMPYPTAPQPHKD